MLSSRWRICSLNIWSEETSPPLRLQAEEVADAKWFAANDATAALPVQAQRYMSGACLTEIAKEA